MSPVTVNWEQSDKQNDLFKSFIRNLLIIKQNIQL